jgi:hypothetical protein
MSTRIRGRHVCALTWIAAAPLALAAAPDAGDLRTLLEKHAGLDPKSCGRLEAGQTVSMLLNTQNPSEVACLGAVIIAVPREYFLSRFRDITEFMKSPQVLEVGRLGDPPSVSDLAKLTLTSTDIVALTRCRPGNCNLKLSKQMMEEIARGIRGSNAASGPVDSVFRAVLIDYVTRYLSEGDAALACYADSVPPICLAKETGALLEEFSLMRDYAPALYEYLAAPRQGPVQGMEDLLYWSEKKIGPLKPVVSVTQVTIHSEQREGTAWSFIASKQIYASHYLRGSLGLTILVDAGRDKVLMLYVNRSRADGLTGFLGAITRAIVRHKLRAGMQQDAARVRNSLEKSYRRSGGSR